MHPGPSIKSCLLAKMTQAVFITRNHHPRKITILLIKYTSVFKFDEKDLFCMESKYDLCKVFAFLTIDSGHNYNCREYFIIIFLSKTIHIHIVRVFICYLLILDTYLLIHV